MVLVVGLQTHLKNIFERTSLFFTPSFWDVLSIILAIVKTFFSFIKLLFLSLDCDTDISTSHCLSSSIILPYCSMDTSSFAVLIFKKNYYYYYYLFYTLLPLV